MKIVLKLIIALGFISPVVAQDLPKPIGDDAYHPIDLSEAALGQLLFYDPILSGNRQTACATCHHPAFGTSDGVSLSFGDGGVGLGPDRIVDPNNIPEERIPRNSPALFNLGAKEFTVLFHDGRLETDNNRESGIRTPMEEDMLSGFTSILSAQTMFPVLSRDEMAGSYDENEIGKLIRQGIITGEGGVWDVLSRRVSAIPDYAQMFIDTYAHIQKPDDIAFTDISNAIATFVAHEWRSDTSLFDAVLAGQHQFSDEQQSGMDLFYGRGQCSTCHVGAFLTDHKFHAVGAPQIGPGKAATFEDHQRDDGRFRVTGLSSDRFAFRTPSLRNVVLTAPYGHAGSHTDLSRFLTSHIDPKQSILEYDQTQVILPPFSVDDFAIMNDKEQVQDIANSVTLQPVDLSQNEIRDLVAFLDTLTDTVAITGRMGIPQQVPSGLTVPRVD